MNLVCFSNNTAGGLVCDLLNNKQYSADGYKLNSIEHSILKVGDSAGVYRLVDLTLWNQRLLTLKKGIYYGTHNHPSCIPNLVQFDNVIAITTSTRESKLYRWLRYYHGWFKSTQTNWIESQDLEKIDKIRILAYNVFEEFEPHPNCINIEFADIVSGKYINENKLNIDYFNIWKERNPWLYTENNESWAVKRFIEAECELLNNMPYRYK